MKLNLQKRDQRALIGLAAALGVYLLTSLVFIPVYDVLSAAEDAAVERQSALEKYRQVVNRKGRYSELIGEVRKQIAQAETQLIRTANPSLAAVEFQTIVEEIARGLDIAINQRNIASAPQQKQPVHEMTMTLAFQCRPDQLVSFLAELRAAPKSIKVRALNLASIEAASAVQKKGQIKKDMRVTMTLAAGVAR